MDHYVSTQGSSMYIKVCFKGSVIGRPAAALCHTMCNLSPHSKQGWCNTLWLTIGHLLISWICWELPCRSIITFLGTIWPFQSTWKATTWCRLANANQARQDAREWMSTTFVSKMYLYSVHFFNKLTLLISTVFAFFFKCSSIYTLPKFI